MVEANALASNFVICVMPDLPADILEKFTSKKNIAVVCVIVKLRRPFSQYFWVNTNNISDSIPSWAKIGFIITFVFFNTFAINMLLQYKKVGKWKNYVYGEKGYIWLSLIAKSVLAWIIVLGTLNQ